MAQIYPSLENIERLKVKPTEGEYHLINYLNRHLDGSYEVFFNPFLDGDRPDFIVLKEHAGAFIIEVKDYYLAHYHVDEYNKWYVDKGRGISLIASPQSQAFRYKKNLYNLHLPVLGLSNLVNSNFYKFVTPLVYLHRADKFKIDKFYREAEDTLRKQVSKLNYDLKCKVVSYDDYNRKADFIKRRSDKLRRDKLMVVGNDKLDVLIKKIKNNSPHTLFDERVYQDFKRRLLPCEHVLKQGKYIGLDKKQTALTLSQEGCSKVKGVAGCGKTTIIASRAANAFKRHHENVLIITFNITLKNLIKDKISDVLGYRDEYNFAVTNYHQFYNSQVNVIGQDLCNLIFIHGLEGLYKYDCFQGEQVAKYNTILIDEVQDFESEWVKIIRDNFLEYSGEMVLFGDESQNIYERDNQRAAVIAQGFGRWIKLKRSYRTEQDSPLNQVFKDFQEQYLVEKYSDTDVLEFTPVQMGMSFNIMDYEAVGKDWIDTSFYIIKRHIQANQLNPNDVVILSSNIFLVRWLNERFIQEEKTHCMFETYEELTSMLPFEHRLLPIALKSGDSIVRLNALKKLTEKELSKLIRDIELKETIDSARRAKKNHFYANSGLIKLSTVHSYKGLESKTVFYLMDDDDIPEIVYTSITRSTENLVILDKSDKNQFSDFFRNAAKAMSTSGELLQ